MALSSDLISQFVKITKDDKKEKSEKIVYGTTKEYAGKMYVKLDGSELLTPVSTTADMKDGERVTVMIKNHSATVTGNVSSPSASSSDVKTIGGNVLNMGDQVSEFYSLVAEKATIKQLEVEQARIKSLEAETVTIKQLLSADNAELGTLITDTATIKLQLDAHSADIETLKSSTAKIDTLEAGMAEIDALIFGSATGNTIHTSFANAVIAQLGDAQIKSAMIDSVSASKITAGDIITNNVRVKSQNGLLLISDETIQISDANRVRVQIGKDASNDYSINIWDEAGKLMFSKGGITDSAIKNAIIRNDMVSDTANIAAHKLDIDSLFEELNGSTKTIQSTRVYLDDKKQTLAVAFKTLDTTVTSQGETIASQGTAISTIQGQIASKVWQQDINTATNTMSTQYSALSQELSGFKTTVGNTYATNARIESAESSITQLTNSLASNVTQTTNLGAKVSTLEQTADGITARIDNLQLVGDNLLVGSKDITKVLYGGATRSDFNDTFKAAICVYDWQGIGITANELISNASAGDEFTFSVNASSTSAVSVWYFAMCLDASNVRVYPTVSDEEFNDIKIGVTSAYEDDKRYTRTFRVTQGWIDLVNAGGTVIWTIQVESNVSPSTPVYLYAPKLERGNKATDWSPAPEDAASTATDYLNFSNAGLVVGDHTVSSLGKNVLIDSEAVKVRTGSTVNAVFGGDIIELAKDNESATISMLKGAFKIYYDADSSDGGFGVYGLTTSGKERLAFQPVNENNNLTLGWGGYADRANSTNLYGHKMYLTTNEDIILNPGSGNVQMDGNVVLTNGKNLFGKRTDGVMRSMAILNASDQMLFGYGSYSNNEGVVYYDGNDVNIRSKNDIRLTTANEIIMLQDGDGNATYSAFFRPNSNAKCTLGTNANRWYAVYASNATIQTSDVREKENIVRLSDIHSELFDRLKPVQYNFIEGTGKTCYGLISQDVIAAMKELGIGEHELDLVHHDVFIGDDGNERETFGIAYSNLLALLIHEVQKLKSEIAEFKIS